MLYDGAELLIYICCLLPRVVGVADSSNIDTDIVYLQVFCWQAARPYKAEKPQAEKPYKAEKPQAEKP